MSSLRVLGKTSLAFMRPNGMRSHWKRPSGQTNVETTFARSVIIVTQKLLARSRLRNHMDSSKLSSTPSIGGKGSVNRLVSRLMAGHSIQSLMSTPFLFIMTTIGDG